MSRSTIALLLLGLTLMAGVATAKNGSDDPGTVVDDKGGLRVDPPSPPKGKGSDDGLSPPSPPGGDDKGRSPSPPGGDDKRRSPSPPPASGTTLYYEATARAVSASKSNAKAKLTLAYNTAGNGTLFGTLALEKIVDFTMARIHLNTTSSKGTVALWLMPQDKSGPLKQPISGTWSVKFSVPGSAITGTKVSTLASLLSSGQVYISVSTTAFPTGELTGIPKVK